MKSWFQDNDIEIYSIHNKGKSVVAKRFFKTSKNKIYKYMTSVLKNVYADIFDDIVHKYNNRACEVNLLSIYSQRLLTLKRKF